VVLALGLTVGLADLAVVAAQRREPVVLPTPAGPYRVGRVLREWTDAGRTDPTATRRGRPRELSVWIWYPAARDAVGQRAVYAPGPWDGLHLTGPLSLFEGPFRAVRTHSLTGVPVARGRFPLVVLGPGLGFAAPQYTAIAEDLASRGYVVAGFTPTHSANLTVLHGRPVGSTTAGNPPTLGAHTGPAATLADRLIQVWAADAHFVAATMAGSGSGSGSGRIGPLAGHVLRGRPAYIGHSFGGAAALQACSTDPRCAGAVDMDGTQFGPVVHDGLRVPFLLLGSENSCVTGSCRPQGAEDRADLATARSLVAASTGPVSRHSIDGSRHLDFTDDAVLHLAWPVRALYALGSIDGDVALRTASRFVAAFLDRVFPRPAVAAVVHVAAQRARSTSRKAGQRRAHAGGETEPSDHMDQQLHVDVRRR
jgi:dienelactone hydrolase